MKFIRAKRVSNCYIPNSKFVCSTNLGFSGGSNRYMVPGTYIPGIMYQYHLVGRGDAGQDAAAATALLGDYHAHVTESDFRKGRQ